MNIAYLLLVICYRLTRRTFKITIVKMCNHRVCAKLKNSGACGSLSVALVAPGPRPMMLLVKQNSGQYEGKYTVCSGKRDEKDNECWVATAVRELREEMKLDMSESQFLQICSSGGETRVIRKGTTPIFVGILNELSVSDKSVIDPLAIFRDSLNRAIEADRNDNELPAEYKEVSRVDWFDLSMKIYTDDENFSDSDIVFSQYATIIFPHLERRYKKLLRRSRCIR